MTKVISKSFSCIVRVITVRRDIPVVCATASQQEDRGFYSQTGTFLCGICMCLVYVFQSPPTVRKHACKVIWELKLFLSCVFESLVVCLSVALWTTGTCPVCHPAFPHGSWDPVTREFSIQPAYSWTKRVGWKTTQKECSICAVILTCSVNATSALPSCLSKTQPHTPSMHLQASSIPTSVIMWSSLCWMCKIPPVLELCIGVHHVKWKQL